METTDCNTATRYQDSLWALRVTYADFEADEFLSLGGAAWPTRDERDASYERVPEVDEPGPDAKGCFVLDVLTDGSIVDGKNISEESAQTLLGGDINQLMAAAREHNFVVEAALLDQP